MQDRINAEGPFIPDKRIRKRLSVKKTALRTIYAGAVWAMKKWYKGNDRMTAKMSGLSQSIDEEFGWTTKLLATLSGRYIYTMLKREEKRLARGWIYEPASFYEKNAAAIALQNEPCRHPGMSMPHRRWVADGFYSLRESHPIIKGKAQ